MLRLMLLVLAWLPGQLQAAAPAVPEASAPAPVPESAQSLRYGVTLFNYYQQDYFSALTELLAAQQLQELGAHDNNAELLRGGMSLAYGMDRVAEQVFRELLDSNVEAGGSVDNSQAWFYLGKITWQRGQLQRASDALARMSQQYEGSLRDEANFLRASINLRSGDESAATAYLPQLPEESPWRYYLYYNLAAAKAARAEWSAAVDYFSKFTPLDADNPESMALQDKAMTAGGYALLAAGESTAAGDYFSRVRLDSPMIDRALLGHGWAAVEREDYRAALAPWQQLGERSLMSASVRESLLAVPYAYEQLGMPGLALSHYQQAAQLYSSEQASLSAATAAFRSDALPPLLGIAVEKELAVSGDESASQAWLFDADILPEGDHAPYLQHLVSRHNFQLALRELRDLYQLNTQLNAARERLQVLAQVDTEQRQVWASIDDGERRDQLLERQQQLRERLQKLGERMQAAASSGDARALVDSAQAARWQRLEKATALAGQLRVSEAQWQQIKLLRGLMIWEDSEQYPGRSWQLRRELEQLEVLAAESRARIDSLDQVIGLRRQAGFEPRIASLDSQVQSQALLVRAATASAEQQIRELAVAELELQAGELATALGQSRLAVARLYDQASPEIPR